jgi:predicted DCC family thiol-disulfide oxidoreductase YuxK
MFTIWYNTKCPVCNAGIEWQHRRLIRAAQAGLIEFRDINLEPAALSRFSAGVEDVRRRLVGRSMAHPGKTDQAVLLLHRSRALLIR